MHQKLSKLTKFFLAAAIYVGFAIYLYQPYFRAFRLTPIKFLFVVNACFASFGCFLLSRRWVSSVVGSFFAGAVYGFGPFALGLAGYHLLAGLLAAAVPWLFIPAAFAPKAGWRALSWPLLLLPFLVILLFFQVSNYLRLFAIPVQTRLQFSDLVALVVPLVATEQKTGLISQAALSLSPNFILPGFYHVPVAALLMGVSMFFAARRFGVMMVFVLGTVLSFYHPVFGISPIIWLTIPILYCSVIIGVGIQGFISAGWADRKWLLATITVMTILAVVTPLMATKYFQVFVGFGEVYASLFVQTAKMYLLGAIVVAVIFFIVRAKVRFAALRQVLLCFAMAIDIFFGARFIIDAIL